jgi:hypothetical protein
MIRGRIENVTTGLEINFTLVAMWMKTHKHWMQPGASMSVRPGYDNNRINCLFGFGSTNRKQFSVKWPVSNSAPSNAGRGRFSEELQRLAWSLNI